MRRDNARWLACGPGMALILLMLASPPLRGDYTPPSQAGSLLGEAFAFVGDFSQWNARHNGLPLDVLEMVPAANEGQAVLLLFWLWLHDPQYTPGGANSASSLPGPTSLGHVISQTASNSPVSPPVGSIVLDPVANTSPSSSSTGISSVSSSSESDTGAGMANNPLSPPPNSGVLSLPPSGNSTASSPPSSGSSGVGGNLPGGDGALGSAGGSNPGTNGSGTPISLGSGGISIPPAGSGTILASGSPPPPVDDGGSTTLLTGSSSGTSPFPNGPSSPIGGDNGNPSVAPPLPGQPASDPGPNPGFSPVPEPNSMTLLALGGIGMGLGWWRQSRKVINTKLKPLASVR